MEVLDRRVALEEAFESAEADAKGEVYTPPVHEPEPEGEAPPVKEPVPIDQDPAQIEQKAAEKAQERERTKGVPLSERGKAPVKAETAVPEVDPAKKSLDKAPQAWGATRDALWAKTPPEVRSVIAKREQEIQQGMSQAGRIRQVAEEYHQVIMPFEGVIRSMNTTPREAITNVMQTATALIIGTQEQKCAVITEMVQRYGVDLPALDKMLTEALKQGDGKLTHIGGNPAPQPLDPRLQPLFALAERLTAADGQRHQQLSEEATAEVNKVVNEPHYEDVKMDMADIMEISAKHGHVMTIQEAYKKACQIHPEISKLVAQTAAKPANTVARARRAASSVKGAPGGPSTGGNMTRREQLEAAWSGN